MPRDYLRERLAELNKELASLVGLKDDEDVTAINTYLERLKLLNDRTKKFYTKDSNGGFPAVKDEDLPELKELYRSALSALEAVSRSGRNDGIWPTAKAITQELFSQLSLDYAALDVTGTADGRTLDDIIRDGRSLAVDVGDQKFSFRSGALSARIPMTVIGPDGVAREGFFTRSVTAGFGKQYEDALDSFGEKYPSLRELFESIKHYSEKERSSLKDLGGTKELQFNLKLNGKSITTATEEEIRETLIETYKESLKDDDANKFGDLPEFIPAMKELGEYYKSLDTAYSTYVSKNSPLQCQPGCNVDRRNAAMSSVAQLFGKPFILAPARPMVVYSGGKALSGTFMETASGHELYDFSDENPIRDADYDTYNSPEAFEDVAALQVIDYVCGNIDRHLGNFFVRFSEQGGVRKFCGIMGIDNDASFPENENVVGPDSQIVPLGDMLVIGEEMATKILFLDKDTLRASLRGYGLSEKSIDLAWKRTEDLQKRIAEGIEHYSDVEPGHLDKGFLRVVPKDEWSHYSLENLAGNNLFSSVLGLASGYNDARREAWNKAQEKKEQELLQNAIDKAAGIPAAGKGTEAVVAVPLGSDLTAGIEADRQRRAKAKKEDEELAGALRKTERELISKIEDEQKRDEASVRFESRMAVEDILTAIKDANDQSIFDLSIAKRENGIRLLKGRFDLSQFSEADLSEAEQYFDRTFQPLIEQQEALYRKFGIKDRTVAGSFLIDNCLADPTGRNRYNDEHVEQLIVIKGLDPMGKEAERYRKAAVVFAMACNGSRIAFEQVLDSTDTKKEPEFLVALTRLNNMKKTVRTVAVDQIEGAAKQDPAGNAQSGRQSGIPLDGLTDSTKHALLSQAKLEELAQMFDTQKTGMFSTDTGTYQDARKALDNYVSALSAVGRQIREFHAAYSSGNSGMTKEQYTQVRNEIVSSSMAVLTQLETDLKAQMTAYEEHASNNGTRTISGISKSAGAVRYAVAKGVLEYLDKAEAIRNGNTVVLTDAQRAERVKETSFLKLFKTNLANEQQGTPEEKRIRAAQSAQTTMDNARWNLPDHR